jgi:predicted component of type VI protein secretion system
VLVSTYHLSDTERVGARRVWIDARPLTIGRAPDCHVVIDDPEVADHHLRITDAGGAIVIDNLASAIDVDGTPVAMGGSLHVGEGRAIRVGGTIVKLRLQEATVTTQAAPPSLYPIQGPPPNPPIPMSVPAPRPPPPRLRPHKDALDGCHRAELPRSAREPDGLYARLVYADCSRATV